MSKSAVFGIFSTKEQVEAAVDEMKRGGFRNADISVLFPCSEGTKDFVLERKTKAQAAGRVTSEALVGGTSEWFAGIGMLVIPGEGPFIAAGPMMALLGGAGVDDSAGGLTGALIGLGIPEYAATRYEGRIKGRCFLFSVHADDARRIRKARKILDQTGAADVTSTGESKSDYANTDKRRAWMSA